LPHWIRFVMFCGLNRSLSNWIDPNIRVLWIVETSIQNGLPSTKKPELIFRTDFSLQKIVLEIAPFRWTFPVSAFFDQLTWSGKKRDRAFKPLLSAPLRNVAI
jgi:hypothetical protein